MYRNLLTDKFFEDNPIIDLSAQQVVYAQMDIPIMTELVSEHVRKYIKRADEERDRLVHEDDPDVLIKMLRGKCDNINYHILYQRVLEQEEVLIPRILKMFKTSLNNIFIEHTVMILVNAQKNYSEELLKMLDEIRSPYALSLACIALGFIADEEVIPILMEKLEYFKKNYPEKEYEQGPLYGLIRMDKRFNYEQ